jgi:hypothetical protein
VKRAEHPSGVVLPDRHDGLYWLRCTECGREWGERSNGAFASGQWICPVRREWNRQVSAS